MATPINLSSVIKFAKDIGTQCVKRIKRKANKAPAMLNTIDSIYTLYLLSSGLVDDMDELKVLLSDKSWQSLPVQIIIITMTSDLISPED